jgi:hypothetical protein
MVPLTSVGLALDKLYGVVNSYVRGPRGRRPGATIGHVDGQIRSAQRSGASQESIHSAIIKGITDSPNALADRVEEIKRRYLNYEGETPRSEVNTKSQPAAGC